MTDFHSIGPCTATADFRVQTNEGRLNLIASAKRLQIIPGLLRKGNFSRRERGRPRPSRCWSGPPSLCSAPATPAKYPWTALISLALRTTSYLGPPLRLVNRSPYCSKSHNLVCSLRCILKSYFSLIRFLHKINLLQYGLAIENPRQEHVLHSIGQLFSSASDAADDDADERFANEVDRAAVVGHISLGGGDDEGNLDLSKPLRVVH